VGDAEAEHDAEQTQHLRWRVTREQKCAEHAQRTHLRLVGDSELGWERVEAEAADGQARCGQAGEKQRAGLEQLAADAAQPVLEHAAGVDALFALVAAAREE
jgi:hypothetical protein